MSDVICLSAAANQQMLTNLRRICDASKVQIYLLREKLPAADTTHANMIVKDAAKLSAYMCKYSNECVELLSNNAKVANPRKHDKVDVNVNLFENLIDKAQIQVNEESRANNVEENCLDKELKCAQPERITFRISKKASRVINEEAKNMSIHENIAKVKSAVESSCCDQGSSSLALNCDPLPLPRKISSFGHAVSNLDLLPFCDAVIPPKTSLKANAPSLKDTLSPSSVSHNVKYDAFHVSDLEALHDASYNPPSPSSSSIFADVESKSEVILGRIDLFLNSSPPPHVSVSKVHAYREQEYNHNYNVSIGQGNGNGTGSNETKSGMNNYSNRMKYRCEASNVKSKYVSAMSSNKMDLRQVSTVTITTFIYNFLLYLHVTQSWSLAQRKDDRSAQYNIFVPE